jgi:adenylylsulfate kinase
MSWAIWITGLPGSGKTTLARSAAAALEARGIPVKVLELDEIREVITPEPAYTDPRGTSSTGRSSTWPGS